MRHETERQRVNPNQGRLTFLASRTSVPKQEGKILGKTHHDQEAHAGQTQSHQSRDESPQASIHSRTGKVADKRVTGIQRLITAFRQHRYGQSVNRSSCETLALFTWEARSETSTRLATHAADHGPPMTGIADQRRNAKKALSMAADSSAITPGVTAISWFRRGSAHRL